MADCPKRKMFVQRLAVPIEIRAWSRQGKRDGFSHDIWASTKTNNAYTEAARVQIGHDAIQSIGTCLFPEARVPIITSTVNRRHGLTRHWVHGRRKKAESLSGKTECLFRIPRACY